MSDRKHREDSLEVRAVAGSAEGLRSLANELLEPSPAVPAFVFIEGHTRYLHSASFHTVVLVVLVVLASHSRHSIRYHTRPDDFRSCCRHACPKRPGGSARVSRARSTDRRGSASDDVFGGLRHRRAPLARTSERGAVSHHPGPRVGWRPLKKPR